MTKLATIVAGYLLLVAMAAIAIRPQIASASIIEQFEKRCGWLDNPTPGNMSLYDGDAEWTISEQGGYEAEGDWEMPTFKRGQWVETNGHYGYGCVCMQIRVDAKTHQALEVKSASARPLAACRQDPALKKWRKNGFR
jgi:hypothetical protein